MSESTEPDFYKLFERYLEEGYSAEQAEELAWKVIQGSTTNVEENTNYLDNPTDNYYCYNCGADFSDWYSLSDEEREHCIESDPDMNPGNLPICCPCCGIPYEDEEDEMY
ncbi:hypothetical protein A6S26_05640 [Nostoc sp. ATCC 43529]|nr:hypothetical protein A6S26_05640 [Nostoc sp. ATCC 43529]